MKTPLIYPLEIIRQFLVGRIAEQSQQRNHTEIDHERWNNKQLLLKRKLGLDLQKCN